MIPYFYNFNTTLFSESLIEEVTDLVTNRLDSFVAYKGKDDVIDGNNYYCANDLKEISEIKSFIKKCSLQCFPVIMLHKPNSSVIKHIDDPNKRNTVIITPLSPILNFSPTYFWNNKEDTEPLVTCNFSKNVSVLFNTQKIHSLINNSNEYRIGLQMCFHESFETILNLYQNGKLI
jgi:hypothetical protein